MQWGSYRESHNLKGNVGLRKFIVAWMLADQDNNRICCSGDEQNRVKPDFIKAMEELGQLPAPVATRIFEKAIHNLGMDASEVEDLEKNSEKTPTAAGSGSKRKPKASAGKSGSGNSKTSTK